MDAVEARRGGAGHIKVPVGPERQMVRGQRGFQRGKHEDLPARADFENRAAAVAHVEIVIPSNARPVATPMPSTYTDIFPVGDTW